MVSIKLVIDAIAPLAGCVTTLIEVGSNVPGVVMSDCRLISILPSTCVVSVCVEITGAQPVASKVAVTGVRVLSQPLIVRLT